MTAPNSSSVRVYYDTEYIERGPDHPIVLVSIGMVREDGEELYLVNGDLTPDQQAYLRTHAWLGPNVWAHLPTRLAASEDHAVLDHSHPDVATRRQIAKAIFDFTLEPLLDWDGDLIEGATGIELWAYFGAYDHVVLSQIFGTMLQLPGHFPMFTRDIKQEANRLGADLSGLPTEAEHHALADARWNVRAHAALESS